MRIIQRDIDQTVYQDLIGQQTHPIVARVIAGRPVPDHAKSVVGITDPRLADLDDPFQMQDMEKAVERIIRAIQLREIIGIETDHDCDGQASHAVIYNSLTQIFNVSATHLQSYIGHRLKEGYGLSERLTRRILAAEPRPSLIITADNGSTDEPSIAQLQAGGIDVIVTDHHALPLTGAPPSAYACLNPTRHDCDFPDACIAGCMVAWLLMAAVRNRLKAQGQLDRNALKMASLLDFVAVGTIADCVSMARSINNRAVVKYGLHIINQSQRPCWQAIRHLLPSGTVQSQDLGFMIGPLLNSDGRLSDAFGAVNFLLSDSTAAAMPWVQQLWQQNQQRKQIQKQLAAQAILQATAQAQAGKVSLVVYLPDGHAGVHGIVASRIKDKLGRPTIIFSPKMQDDQLITGSARSIDDVNVYAVLQQVAAQSPALLQKFGGHKAAAGLVIKRADLAEFTTAFEDAVQRCVTLQEVGPCLLTDGVLPLDHFNLAMVDQLQSLEPYGREFDPPQFVGEFSVKQCRVVGSSGTHAQLVLQLQNGEQLSAIWFDAAQPGEPLALAVGQSIRAVFVLQGRWFGGSRKLQLQVKHTSSLH